MSWSSSKVSPTVRGSKKLVGVSVMPPFLRGLSSGVSPIGGPYTAAHHHTETSKDIGCV